MWGIQLILARASNVALVVMAATVFYWLFLDRAVPIEIDNYVLVESEVVPGGVIEVRVQLTRHRSCPAKINRYLTDSRDISFLIPPAARQITMNGHDNITIRVSAPAGAASGPAEFWSEAEYRCNPLQWLWPIHVIGPKVSIRIIDKLRTEHSP